MRFTPGFIEEVKYRNPIETVVSSYVNLKRAGSNMTGLCPFHNEKTASFFIFPSSETYHCFGCGAGGDVITFVMSAENLDYPSAVEFLCKRAGMEMPAESEHDKSELVRRSRIYELNREAAHFFHDCLSEPEAENARNYLKNKRRLSDSVITRFGLGYAPKTFDRLRNYMHNLGYSDEELKTAFLCGMSEKNGRTHYFDYFRGRVIFPIIDNFQNVIAFGGRAIEEGDSPKYLNSSDTPVFKKSRNLFALNFARTCCSDYLILCEGYMDVISVNAAGFSNAVATLGTALTSEQARIMAKYTKRVIIAYDSDEAGTNAAKRAIPILTEAGVDVKVLQMKGAKDPDEYIKTFGKDKFRLLIENSTGKLDYWCDTVLKKYDILVPEQKIKAARELCAVAADVYSDVERDVYIARIAERLEVDKESIKNDVKRIRAAKRKEEKTTGQIKMIEKSLGYGDRVNRDYAKNALGARAEETILGILLLFPEYVSDIKKGKIFLTAEDFVTDFNRRVFLALSKEDTVPDIGMLGAEFTTEEIGRIVSMQVARKELGHNDLSVLEDNIAALKKATEKKSGDDLADTLFILNQKKNKQ